MSSRQIIVHLPSDISVEDHADLANAVWAVAAAAESVEVTGPDAEQVNVAMDDLWRTAPEWTPRGWRRPRGGR